MHFQRMFPTVWRAEDIWRLRERVDVREIDLIIIASNVDEVADWPQKAHVICFSKNIGRLPGPIPRSYLKISDKAETEEFLFPGVSLSISRRREADYGDLTSVRGWSRLELQFEFTPRGPGITETQRKSAISTFSSGSIICELHTNSTLAVAFIREESNLGISWLPNVNNNRAAWVELLVAEWAQIDKDAFPYFGDWTKSPEWMVAEEERIISEIEALNKKKQETVNKINMQISGLSTSLVTAELNANKGLRRLITAQGPELVDEVMKALSKIGFRVTSVDDQIADDKRKREDLRLSHSSQTGDKWTAIVEVRGYTKSAGKTSDLQRLSQFADLYQRETGQFPDKRIYIVNGQLEIAQPSQRQEPLASTPDDLAVFSDADGILIWSIDLFRALKTTDPADYPALIESIKDARGKWKPIQTKET